MPATSWTSTFSSTLLACHVVALGVKVGVNVGLLIASPVVTLLKNAQLFSSIRNAMAIHATPDLILHVVCFTHLFVDVGQDLLLVPASHKVHAATHRFRLGEHDLLERVPHNRSVAGHALLHCLRSCPRRLSSRISRNPCPRSHVPLHPRMPGLLKTVRESICLGVDLIDDSVR